MIHPIYDIKVPATSANIGSGFDTMGIAFQLYNNFTVQELDTNELIIQGVDKQFQTKENLFYQSAQKIFNKLNYPVKGLLIQEDCQVPFGKGLGSSSTCIIGGLVLANEICNHYYSNDDLLNIATKIEGHPDNVAPALFGNLTASLISDRTYTLVEKVNPKFHFWACVPNFELFTEQSRDLLPVKYPRKDVIYNISHSIITFESLINGNSKLLKLALDDKIHQPFRFKIIEGSKQLLNFIKSNNFIGAYLSGAGPTIIVITNSEQSKSVKILRNFIKSQLNNWKVIKLLPDTKGCTIDIKN